MLHEPSALARSNLSRMPSRLTGAAIAAMLLAGAPFAFAMIRIVQTDARDMRYLWVAFAAFAGAMLRMAIAMRGSRRMTRGALGAGVFLVSTAAAAFTALMLGTRVGPAMFLVAAAFGACFAMSTYLRMPRR